MIKSPSISSYSQYVTFKVTVIVHYVSYSMSMRKASTADLADARY